MKKIILLLIFLLTIAVIAPICVYADVPNFIVEYDFDGTLTDSMGHSTLTAFGTSDDGNGHNNLTSGFATDGAASSDQTYWYWTSDLPRGGGFHIDVGDTSIAENYSIGVRFWYDDVVADDYDKIIDYQNMTSDDGFYFYYNNLLFYPEDVYGPTFYTGGSILDVIVTRNATTDEFIAYTVVDGTLVQEFTYIDSSDEAVPITIGSDVRFGFFFDDTYTDDEATTGGRVYSIKIWDGAITSAQAQIAMDSGQGAFPNPSTGKQSSNVLTYTLCSLGALLLVVSVWAARKRLKNTATEK